MRLTLLVVLSACGGTEVAASHYDQACSLDGDCTAVFQGDVCTPCTCPNAGITAASRAKYEADVARLKAQCGPTPAVACAACTPTRGLCINKTCSTRPE